MSAAKRRRLVGPRGVKRPAGTQEFEQHKRVCGQAGEINVWLGILHAACRARRVEVASACCAVLSRVT